jgi:hypothetical protein
VNFFSGINMLWCVDFWRKNRSLAGPKNRIASPEVGPLVGPEIGPDLGSVRAPSGKSPLCNNSLLSEHQQGHQTQTRLYFMESQFLFPKEQAVSLFNWRSSVCFTRSRTLPWKRPCTLRPIAAP